MLAVMLKMPPLTLACPLQAALILANITGENCASLRRAVLVESHNAVMSHWDTTLATLNALGCSAVKRVTL